MINPSLAALALLIENLTGYPGAVYARIGHPVEWFGKVISALENKLNSPADTATAQKQKGVLLVLVLSACVLVPAILLQWLTMSLPYGWVANVLLAAPLIAQKSMRDHVSDVASALTHRAPVTSSDINTGHDSDLAPARMAVAKIVGRDTTKLGESGISKAALESLAENTSDGIVAPALWYAVAGLPGIAFYKAINTADSMIGHKTERYLHFGWTAARLDDLINLPASRLTGLLFAASAWLSSATAAKQALTAMWRDASKHGSPNAGWPESAMAGALGLRFGGPRAYEGEIVDLPWMGDGRETMDRTDIAAGLKLFDRACLMLAAVLFLAALAI
jgi:adenosylcobinamide-phosphate synthase